MTTELPERFELSVGAPIEDRLSALRAAFPEAVLDGRVDIDALKRALGEWVDSGPERYGLTWPGKAACARAIQEPSVGTVVPAPDESVAWDATGNVIIEGDNLEVLKLLQKAYYGKVKFIYIDPPYNTGKEFIYPDNWREGLTDYLRYSGQLGEEGFKLSANAETDGRYHSKWLSMMYPRLFLARNLLRDDGVIFVSIDDHEIHNLGLLMNEIFGEENFVECIVWNKRIPKNDKGIGNIHEYVLVYVRNSSLEYKFTMPKQGLDEVNELVATLKRKRVPIPEAEAELKKLYEKKGYDRAITLYNSLDDSYRVWGKINVSWPNATTFGPRYDVLHPITKKPVAVPDRGWRWKRETFDELLDYDNVQKRPDGSYICGSIWFDSKESTQPSLIKYLDDVDTLLLRSILSLKSDGGIEVDGLLGEKNLYAYPKPTSLLKTLIQSAGLQDDDIVLDFFAGSGTTGHAVMEANADDGINRRYVMVQLPEPTDREDFPTIAAITRQRIRAAGSASSMSPTLDGGPDVGFRSYRLAPSNFAVWDASATSAEAVEQQLEMSVDHVLDGATEHSMLTELLLKAGYPLTASVEELEFAGVTGYSVSDGALLVCLSRSLSIEVFEAMVEREPVMILVLDAGFGGDDELKVNALQTVRARNQSAGSDITLRVV